MTNHKFCKRLSSFLKLKKYRKIGLRGLSGPGVNPRTRRIFPRTLKYNGLKRQYFLGRDQSFFYLGDKTKTNITKKKGGVLSYLFTVICRFPRKYVYWLLGRGTFRRYYTMPLRLSMSRFVSYLTFKGYYGPKCAQVLRRLLRLRSKITRQQVAKSAIMHIEQRLDSCILRLLHFKPLFTTKIPIRFRVHKVKSPPLGSHSSLQIQQFISHGSVSVNGGTSRFGNMKIGICDLVGLIFESRKSFIKFGSFSKVFYMIYRNMYLVDRILTAAAAEKTGVRCTNVEKDVKLFFDAVASDRATALLWPVLSLLKISVWPLAKSNILARRDGLSKESRWNRRSQLQRLLRWKRLQSTAKTIDDQLTLISKQDPSLMYSRFSRCYASIVYGTRRCEWVQLQQRGSKGSFYGTLYHKTNFLESELDYFQLLIRHYF